MTSISLNINYSRLTRNTAKGSPHPFLENLNRPVQDKLERVVFLHGIQKLCPREKAIRQGNGQIVDIRNRTGEMQSPCHAARYLTKYLIKQAGLRLTNPMKRWSQSRGFLVVLDGSKTRWWVRVQLDRKPLDLLRQCTARYSLDRILARRIDIGDQQKVRAVKRPRKLILQIARASVTMGLKQRNYPAARRARRSRICTR